MAKRKYYVVWDGVQPGIYDNWEECKLQIIGYKNALYKSFESHKAASDAYEKGYAAFKASSVKPTGNYIRQSLAVDAACSGNPGDMEYRGVYVETGKEIFRIGPYKEGTNNIGEFLALVHGLALLKKMGKPIPVYSDSRNAILWVKNRKCKTLLKPVPANAPLFELIARAEKWLHENTYANPILKWDTAEWGEIPADFGRK